MFYDPNIGGRVVQVVMGNDEHNRIPNSIGINDLQLVINSNIKHKYQYSIITMHSLLDRGNTVVSWPFVSFITIPNSADQYMDFQISPYYIPTADAHRFVS